MEKTRGFIYLWYDRKHKRYYLGKHWGEPDDGYDCSSRWMRAARKRRPQDFKRRILQWIYDRDELSEAERRWGTLIKPEELRSRYYNIVLPGGKQWHDDPKSRLTVGQKISKANKGKIPPNKGKPSPLRGCSISEAQKSQISDTLKGKSHTDERRKNQSEAGKNRKRACCIACRKEMHVSALFHWHEGKCQ